MYNFEKMEMSERQASVSRRPTLIKFDSVVCRFYSFGECVQQGKCRLPHVEEEGRILDTVCRYYLKNGCSFGNRCEFDHVNFIEIDGVKYIQLVEKEKEVKNLEKQKGNMNATYLQRRGARVTRSQNKRENVFPLTGTGSNVHSSKQKIDQFLGNDSYSFADFNYHKIPSDRLSGSFIRAKKNVDLQTKESAIASTCNLPVDGKIRGKTKPDEDKYFFTDDGRMSNSYPFQQGFCQYFYQNPPSFGAPTLQQNKRGSPHQSSMPVLTDVRKKQKGSMETYDLNKEKLFYHKTNDTKIQYTPIKPPGNENYLATSGRKLSPEPFQEGFLQCQDQRSLEVITPYQDPPELFYRDTSVVEDDLRNQFEDSYYDESHPFSQVQDDSSRHKSFYSAESLAYPPHVGSNTKFQYTPQYGTESFPQLSNVDRQFHAGDVYDIYYPWSAASDNFHALNEKDEKQSIHSQRMRLFYASLLPGKNHSEIPSIKQDCHYIREENNKQNHLTIDNRNNYPVSTNVTAVLNDSVYPKPNTSESLFFPAMSSCQVPTKSQNESNEWENERAVLDYTNEEALFDISCLATKTSEMSLQSCQSKETHSSQVGFRDVPTPGSFIMQGQYDPRMSLNEYTDNKLHFQDLPTISPTNEGIGANETLLLPENANVRKLTYSEIAKRALMKEQQSPGKKDLMQLNQNCEKRENTFLDEIATVAQAQVSASGGNYAESGKHDQDILTKEFPKEQKDLEDSLFGIKSDISLSEVRKIFEDIFG